MHQIPVLTVEEEQALANRFRDAEDLDAAKQLVLSHLRFVVHVARGYQGYGLGMGDLIQEGNIGLMKAVKRFDPDMGVRLVSFAVHWIRAEMHEFILRNWRIVKVATTKAQRKLFFNLRKNRKRLGWMTAAERSSVAKDLGVPVADVLEMESRLSGHDMAFDAPTDADDDAKPSPVATSGSMRPRTRTTSIRRRRRRSTWSPTTRIRRRPTSAPTAKTTSSNCCAKASRAWMRVRATSSSAAGSIRRVGLSSEASGSSIASPTARENPARSRSRLARSSCCRRSALARRSSNGVMRARGLRCT